VRQASGDGAVARRGAGSRPKPRAPAPRRRTFPSPRAYREPAAVSARPAVDLGDRWARGDCLSFKRKFRPAPRSRTGAVEVKALVTDRGGFDDVSSDGPPGPVISRPRPDCAVARCTCRGSQLGNDQLPQSISTAKPPMPLFDRLFRRAETAATVLGARAIPAPVCTRALADPNLLWQDGRPQGSGCSTCPSRRPIPCPLASP
jgi:hypothetical protein